MTEIVIDLKDYQLKGILLVPERSHQLVIFAHGSGSSRLSARSQYVARALNDKGIATCLFDLLTEEEEVIDELTREFRFDISLLATRLVDVTFWLQESFAPSQFDYGYFGSSTGAAAALIASTECQNIKAVVSRGGRPDLAGDTLKKVTASTLFIVGALDADVINLNQYALSLMSAPSEIAIVPNATHLFEEPGTLDVVIDLASEWFMAHLL